jgi:hypothetical protein
MTYSSATPLPLHIFFRSLVTDGEVKVSGPREALCSDHLEYGVAGLESEVLPALEVVSTRDGACGARGPSHGPVLVEASGAVDLGDVLVVQIVDVVDATVAVDLPDDLAVAGRAGAVLLDDIPFGHGVSCPSIEGKGVITRGTEVASPGEGPELR